MDVSKDVLGSPLCLVPVPLGAPFLFPICNGTISLFILANLTLLSPFKLPYCHEEKALMAISAIFSVWHENAWGGYELEFPQ